MKSEGVEIDRPEKNPQDLHRDCDVEMQSVAVLVDVGIVSSSPSLAGVQRCSIGSYRFSVTS